MKQIINVLMSLALSEVSYGAVSATVSTTNSNNSSPGASTASTPVDAHAKAMKESKIDVNAADDSMAGTNLPESNTNTPRTRNARRDDYHKSETSSAAGTPHQKN